MTRPELFGLNDDTPSENQDNSRRFLTAENDAKRALAELLESLLPSKVPEAADATDYTIRVVRKFTSPSN